MKKDGLLMTVDKEDDAKDIVKRLNDELRHRGLWEEYYCFYLAHRLARNPAAITYAIYQQRRKEVDE